MMHIWYKQETQSSENFQIKQTIYCEFKDTDFFFSVIL